MQLTKHVLTLKMTFSIVYTLHSQTCDDFIKRYVDHFNKVDARGICIYDAKSMQAFDVLWGLHITELPAILAPDGKTYQGKNAFVWADTYFNMESTQDNMSYQGTDIETLLRRIRESPKGPCKPLDLPQH